MCSGSSLHFLAAVVKFCLVLTMTTPVQLKNRSADYLRSLQRRSAAVRAPANKMPSQMRKSGAAGLLELTLSTKVPLVGYGQAGIHG
jgi:hypothetical protein